MKNLLVVLVTIGMGYAYWYQRPEPPAPAQPTPAVTVAAPAPRPVFTAAHSALDDPATPAGTGSRQAAVLLGDDKSQPAH